MDIKFVHGDATVIDWSDADVVFANSTCFDDETMEKLACSASRLRVGAFFLTTTRRFAFHNGSCPSFSNIVYCLFP